LLYISEVRRRTDGVWLVERYDLGHGALSERTESLAVPAEEASRLPPHDRLYLEDPESTGDPLHRLRSLFPLLTFDADSEEVFFLNARRKKRRAEFLCYSSGETHDRDDLIGERRALLQTILELPPEQVQLEVWEAHSHAEEPAATSESDVAAKYIGE